MDEVCADAGSAKFTTMDFGGGIVANDADIVCAEPPALASNEGGGDLASGHDAGTEHLDFRPESGETRETQDGVGSVFADAEDVESRGAHKIVVQGIE